MNKVMLVGRLTRDPELRSLPSGKHVATITVALKRHGTDAAELGSVREVSAMISWMRHLSVLGGILLVLSGCAVDHPMPSPSASLPTLPGPPQHLPAAAGSGASWVRAEGRLPSGIDRAARYSSVNAAFLSLTEPFRRRQLPPPGLTGEVIKSDSNEEWILITIPTGAKAPKVGEQFLLVLREDAGGWMLADVWARDLCAGDIDHESCL